MCHFDQVSWRCLKNCRFFYYWSIFLPCPVFLISLYIGMYRPGWKYKILVVLVTNFPPMFRNWRCFSTFRSLDPVWILDFFQVNVDQDVKICQGTLQWTQIMDESMVFMCICMTDPEFLNSIDPVMLTWISPNFESQYFWAFHMLNHLLVKQDLW